jgi:hypothetical protein
MPHAKSKSKVFLYGQPWEKSRPGILKEHYPIAPGTFDWLAVQCDTACSGLFETSKDVQQSGFPTPRCAKKTDELAILNLQIYARESEIPLGLIAVPLCNVVNPQHTLARCWNSCDQ